MSKQRVLFAVALMSPLIAAISLTGQTVNNVFGANGKERQLEEYDGANNSAKGESEHESYNNSTRHTDSEEREQGEGSSKKAKSDEDKERGIHGEKSAEERHNDHLARHAPTTGSYSAGLNYTLTVKGVANPVSNSSMSEDATISMQLSVWKSTEGMLAMDVMGGTVRIGSSETYDITSGIALVSVHAHKLLVFAHTSEDKGNLIILKASAPEDAVLPAEDSDHALALDVLSPQSKIASEWFLSMQGEIILS